MNKKAVVTIVALAVALVCAVGGMVAYLTSTDSVKNTFTVGNVAITLDEAPVDEAGKATDGDRVKANKYKLMPGGVYDKDPVIHVGATSEDCWLFVDVANGIADIEDKSVSIDVQMKANGWAPVDGQTSVYAYGTTVSKGTDVPLFTTFTVSESTGSEIANYENATVEITAYAIQSAGLDAAAAWEAIADAYGF